MEKITLEQITTLQKTYEEILKGFSELKILGFQATNPKLSKAEVIAIQEKIVKIKAELEEAVITFGSLESIEERLRSLRKQFVSENYLTLKGNSLRIDDEKTIIAEKLGATTFKIEIDAEVVRSFQNENVYVSLDLSKQSNVNVMLPSIKSLKNNLNVNIWLSDISGTIGGEFKLEIIADEDEKDTISGLESVVLSESFSGALITPIARNQWAIFYAQNVSKGTFVSELNQSVDFLKEQYNTREIVRNRADSFEVVKEAEVRTKI